MKSYLISQAHLDEVLDQLCVQQGVYLPPYVNEMLVGNTPVVQWLPIDPANPIPKPTNERQVLQLYKPKYDNEQSLRAGQSPIVTLRAVLYGGLKATRPLQNLFYWDNYDWRSDDTKDQTIEEGWLEIGYTMYCIFESPKPTQP